MTILISGDAATNLSTYQGLRLSVADWLDRDDLTSRIPDFIRLAEAKFRRDLIMPDMETSITITPAASVPLPVDFDSMRSLGIAGFPAMRQRTPADFGALGVTPVGTPYTGLPTEFMIAAGTMSFWPTPDRTYSMTMLYRANLPSLSTLTASNWLLDKHPDAYLYATLLQAELYGWNDARLPLIQTGLDEVMMSITMSGTRKRYGSGPLQMKTTVRQTCGGRI